MKNSFRATKIICTIGPSSSDEKILKEMILSGMDVARLNLSHGDHHFHKKVIRNIRRLSKELKRPVGILFDLQGIKLRIGELEKGFVELKKGSPILLKPGQKRGNERTLYISYKRLLEDLNPGDRVLLDDGLIELKIKDRKPDALIAEVLEGGLLRERKGVNFPHSSLKESAFTDKDREDLSFGLKEGIDIIALSFVRDAEDIISLKNWLKRKNVSLPIIAKIEKPEALKNIEPILEEVDGIMIARGDLGVEMHPEEVPIIQKSLIKKANEYGKVTITATQMLESMTSHLRPTRAETTDVANAILDGSDCLMLSAETATGRYPVEALKMMLRIIQQTERASINPQRIIPVYKYGIPEAIAHAACNISRDIGIKFIVAFTKTGFTARLMSKFRPHVPVIAFTPDERILTRLCIYRGVRPMFLKRLYSTDELINEVEKILLHEGLVSKGDTIVITGSLPPSFKEGKTNFLKIHQID